MVSGTWKVSGNGPLIFKVGGVSVVRPPLGCSGGSMVGQWMRTKRLVSDSPHRSNSFHVVSAEKKLSFSVASGLARTAD